MASFLKQRQVFIIATTTPALLQIFNVYGRVLSKQDISVGQNTINLADLPTGILIFVSENQRYNVLKE